MFARPKMEVRRIKQRRAELFEEVMQQLDSPKAGAYTRSLQSST
jgi:hypothetical protein